MTSLLGGCASMQSQDGSPPPPQPLVQQEKIVVGQGAVREYEEYVACLENQPCAQRTPKHLQSEKAKTHAGSLPGGTSHRVHFEWSKSDVTANERARLASFATERVRNAKEIVIRGGTDPTGARSFNYRLAQRRAEAVKRELITLGVPASRITARRHEPCCEQPPAAGPMSNQDLRRADIEIEIRTGTKQ